MNLEKDTRCFQLDKHEYSDLCDKVKGEPRQKDKSHGAFMNWTSGRPPDSVMDFRLTFEEGQA